MTTPRHFLAGLASAIVVTAVPFAPVSAEPPRDLPPIILDGTWAFTPEALGVALGLLSDQVAALVKFDPTEAEVKQIIEQVAGCIDQFRPVGISVMVQTSYHNMLRVEFAFVEDVPGRVVIQ